MSGHDDIDWYALSNGIATVMPDGTLVDPEIEMARRWCRDGECERSELSDRISKLEMALHRIKGHCQNDETAEELESAQTDLRAIFAIATEALSAGGKI